MAKKSCSFCCTACGKVVEFVKANKKPLAIALACLIVLKVLL